MYPFSDWKRLRDRLGAFTDGEPFVVQSPGPGQKEVRFAHLLSGEPEIEATPVGERAAGATPRRAEQRETLEQKVDRLSEEVEKLRAQFEEFKKQFE
jgi:uncharacterized protein YceH (UPF0502 family)